MKKQHTLYYQVYYDYSIVIITQKCKKTLNSYLRMPAIVQQLQTIQEQCSDRAIVFLVLVFLQHHIASNSERKLNRTVKSLDKLFVLKKL